MMFWIAYKCQQFVLLISACHITSFLKRVSHFIRLSVFKLVIVALGKHFGFFEAWCILKPIHGISAYRIWRFSTQLVNNKLSKAYCTHDIVMCEVDAFIERDSLCTNYRDSPLEATRGLGSCSKAQWWRGSVMLPALRVTPHTAFYSSSQIMFACRFTWPRRYRLIGDNI